MTQIATHTMPLFRSYLETQLWLQMTEAGLPPPLSQFPLCDHAADFAWPKYNVCVEVQGATWVQGAHTRGGGYADDRLLSNRRQMAGWLCLEFTADHLNADQAVPMIEQALRQRGWTG